MKFSELSEQEQKDLAEYGELISMEMEAKSEPNPNDPILDTRWDPSRELSRLNYRCQAIEKEIKYTVYKSRKNGQLWNTIGRALGVTAEFARRKYNAKLPQLA